MKKNRITPGRFIIALRIDPLLQKGATPITAKSRKEKNQTQYPSFLLPQIKIKQYS